MRIGDSITWNVMGSLWPDWKRTGTVVGIYPDSHDGETFEAILENSQQLVWGYSARVTHINGEPLKVASL